MRDFPLFSGISRFFPFFFFFFFRGFESSPDSLDGNVINGRSFVFVIFLIIIGTFSSFFFFVSSLDQRVLYIWLSKSSEI